MQPFQAWLEFGAKLFFALASLILLLFALSLVGIAAFELVRGLALAEPLLKQTLESIGLVIIALAVFDLAKFLVEEEIVRERELRTLTEARRSLTKFFTIIILAILLEGIVLVFETRLDDVRNLIYPTALMAVGVLALVGLGIFHKLTSDSGPPNRADDRDELDGEDETRGRAYPAPPSSRGSSEAT